MVGKKLEPSKNGKQPPAKKTLPSNPLDAPFANPLEAPLVRPKISERLWGKNVESVEADPGCVVQVSLRGDIVCKNADAKTQHLAYVPHKHTTAVQRNVSRMAAYDDLVQREKAKCEELRAAKRAAKAASRQLRVKVPRTPSKRKPPTAKKPATFTCKKLKQMVAKPAAVLPNAVETKDDEEEDEEEEEDDEDEEEDEEEEPEDGKVNLEDDLAPSAGEEDDDELEKDDEDDELPEDVVFGDNWQDYGNDDWCEDGVD